MPILKGFLCYYKEMIGGVIILKPYALHAQLFKR
ncbi:hypothetical protein NEOC65_002454 [Neochlamydia sp. AcF65]|nr:hypothetical protein [Neochlamydia sp. AcF65]MBS4171372.1 hypothetical protein [Neochlamydia sp. AcF95]